MRRGLPLLLALLAVAPSAAALGLPTALSVSVAPPAGPIPPGEDGVSLPVEVVLTRAGPALQPTTVTLAVAEAPAWANVWIEPATVTFPADASSGGTPRRATVQLRVHVTSDAPAFAPALVRLAAYVPEDPLHQKGDAAESTAIAAGWFSILHVEAVAETLQLIDGAAEGGVAVHNFGNGLTRLVLDAKALPDGVEVLLPQPVVVESKQQGGVATSAVLPVRFFAREDALVSLRLTTAYALDHAREGPAHTVTFRLVPSEEPRPFTVQVAEHGVEPPSAPFWGALLGAAAGFAAYRVRGRRDKP